MTFVSVVGRILSPSLLLGHWPYTKVFMAFRSLKPSPGVQYMHSVM